MLSKEQAHEDMQVRINSFRTDLAYTAPELYELKWQRFREVMHIFVERIYGSDDSNDTD